eukprot:s2378_g7.t1
MFLNWVAPSLLAPLPGCAFSWHVVLVLNANGPDCDNLGHPWRRSLQLCLWFSGLLHYMELLAVSLQKDQLRKKAVNVTGLRCGGSNPLLRFSLAEPMTADPGFYHLRTCVMDFRRLCCKSPDLLVLWRSHMPRFDGRKLPGPFFKLVDLFGMLGWCILEPPFFLDHDGFEYNLMDLPNKTIELLLREGWLQYVSQQVQHRGTMHDLVGLDYGLTLLDRKTMTPQDLGKTMALQSGSFISEWVHSKYDKTKEPLCPHCNVPNTLRHWTSCPAFAQLQAVRLDDRAWISQAPDCVVHHLLVPRSPFALELKRYFMGIEDTTCVFHSQPGEGSIARAELSSALAALRWSYQFGAQTHLWSDSLSTVSDLQSLLDGTWHFSGPDVENHDLWQQAAELIDCLPPDSFFVHWVPSHLDTSLCETTWEEWAAEWNDIADQIAVQVNQHREESFLRLKQDAIAHHETWTQRIRNLRRFFFAVSELKQEAFEVIDLTVSDTHDWAEMGLIDAFSEDIPVSWRAQLSSEPLQLKYPSEFVFQLFELAFSLETESDAFAAVTFLEFTLWCIIEQETPFPFWNPDSLQWELRQYHSLLVRPTLASLVHVAKHVFVKGISILGLGRFLIRGIQKPEIGLFLPCDGLAFCTSFAIKERLANLCSQKAGRQGFRKSADLAKPFGDVFTSRSFHTNKDGGHGTAAAAAVPDCISVFALNLNQKHHPDT